MKAKILPLLVFGAFCAPLAAQTLIMSGTGLKFVSVDRLPGNQIIMGFSRSGNDGGVPFALTNEVFLRRSFDGAATWSAVTRPHRSLRWEINSTLLPDGNGGCVLFIYGSTNVGISVFVNWMKRSTSPDCINFDNETLIEFGHLPGPPAMARDANGVLTMAYSGDSPNYDILVLRSTDNGLTWEPERTVAVAAGRNSQTDYSFIYHPASQRYLLLYSLSGKRWLKSSGSGGARDWNTTPVEAPVPYAGTGRDLTLLPDGSLLMSGAAPGGLMAAHSVDGVNWGAPFTVDLPPGVEVSRPFILAGSSPTAFDVYWTVKSADATPVYSFYWQSAHLPDQIFLTGFEP